MPKGSSVSNNVVYGAPNEETVVELGDLNRQQRLGYSFVVPNPVEREQRVHKAWSVNRTNDIINGVFICNGMDKQCSGVVANNGNGGSVVIVFRNGKAAREGWEERKGGRKGMFEVLDYYGWWSSDGVVTEEKTFLNGNK
ncbi:hypothetical protein S245_014528 [Arachis hypogaea]